MTTPSPVDRIVKRWSDRVWNEHMFLDTAIKGAICDALNEAKARVRQQRDDLLVALKTICDWARDDGREMPVYEDLIRRVESSQ